MIGAWLSVTNKARLLVFSQEIFVLEVVDFIDLCPGSALCDAAE
jgi:hypothetical protein